MLADAQSNLGTLSWDGERGAPVSSSNCISPSGASGRLLHDYNPVTRMCDCPGCTLAFYMNAVVYGSQKLASPEVMAEMPSVAFRGNPPPYESEHDVGSGEHCHREGPGSVSLPPPPAPPRLTSCPMFDAFGFCIYGRTCLLPHDASVAVPLHRGPSSLEDSLKDVIDMGNQHMASEVWRCAVCGFDSIYELNATKVGETCTYRYCPNCTVACYLPQVLHLVELLIDAVGDDYQLYKTKVEEYRAAVPDLLKIPLTYEAHRIATTIFAWSLVGPADAQFALDVVAHHHPKIDMMISLGAGTGYVEHVFNRVANGVAAVPHGPSIGGSASSFDGVVSKYFTSRSKHLSFFAFDEIIRPVQYSVVVNYGAPNVLQSLDCTRAALLLSWPPFGSPEEEQSSMGFEALRYYVNGGGKVVVYVGDVSSTGDWRFHGLLQQEFVLCHEYYVRKELRRWYPQEMGLVYAGCDTIGVYVRRAPSAASSQ